MDPISLIVSALVSGAGSMITIGPVNKAVSDTYQSLKKLIEKKLSETEDEQVITLVFGKFEKNPEAWKRALKEELAKADVGNDPQIIETAQELKRLVTPKDAAFERIASASNTNRKQLEQIYEQRKWQASLWTKVSVAAATIGFLVILSGIIAAFAGNITPGLITTASGLITEGAAALFFRQVNDANKRVDSILDKLLEIDKVNRAIEISLIADDESQDNLKKIILFQVLGLPSQKLETDR
jgi:hypothetical protein